MVEEKTPEELAKKEVNKKLAKAIASREMDIKRHQAEIKKLEKEINKIKSGELVPEEDESPVKERIIERVIEKEKRNDRYNYPPYTPNRKKYDYYISPTTTPNLPGGRTWTATLRSQR